MVLTAEMATGEELFRLQSEAQALGRLQHPHIVQIFETGSHDGRPFLALEYCPGGSLADRLRGTPLAPRPAAEMVETLALAMHSAHEQGVVHRDLKPGNVLLRGQAPAARNEKDLLSRLKITDFGLAKRLDQDGHSRTGDIMGTPNYMAPEQAAGRPRDTGPRTDVFALGAILYELLTGGTPFRAPTPWETIRLILTEDPVPPTRLQPRTPRGPRDDLPDVPQKEPARRYPSALALADDLRRWLDGEPIHARPVGRLERLVKWVRRRPADAAVVAVSVVAAVFLLALGGAYLQMNLLKTQKDTLAGEVSDAGGAEDLQRPGAAAPRQGRGADGLREHDGRGPGRPEGVPVPRDAGATLRVLAPARQGGFAQLRVALRQQGVRQRQASVPRPALRQPIRPTASGCSRPGPEEPSPHRSRDRPRRGRIRRPRRRTDLRRLHPRRRHPGGDVSGRQSRLVGCRTRGDTSLIQGHKGEALHVAAGPKGVFATAGTTASKSG